jgi:aminotransferase in exopolysaccharide biosynthesis
MDNNLSTLIVETLKSSIGASPQSLHEPSFKGNEWLYIKECLDLTFVSSVGKFVDKFENDLVDFTGAKHAVAVVNGTAALHIALKLAGVCADDEVLVPALTFVATANAVTYCNAVPHFVDSEEITLGIDASKLRHYLKINTRQDSGNCVNQKTGRIIRAIVPMHTFGHPSNLEELLEICEDFNLVMVEDAAEAIGSYYKNQHVGTFGLIGTLSFNGNKTITTGGGGAILTNDDAIARKAKHLTTTAKLPHPWEFRHDQIGFNYRMPNINAALGCAQLEQLPEKLKLKRDLFNKYSSVFNVLEGISIFKEPVNCQSNYWLQTLLLDQNMSSYQNSILQDTNLAGYMTRPSWVLLNELAPFSDFPSMDTNTSKSLSSRIINIPSNLDLSPRNL